MDYSQSELIEGLYKRFRALCCEKTFLFIETERKLYNTQLPEHPLLSEVVDKFINKMDSDIKILEAL